MAAKLDIKAHKETLETLSGAIAASQGLTGDFVAVANAVKSSNLP